MEAIKIFETRKGNDPLCPNGSVARHHFRRAVSHRHGSRSSGFQARRVRQDEAMESLDYAQLSEDEMAAADRSESLDECQKHLDRALRYAQLACLERHRPGQSNVVHIGSSRRDR